MQLLQPAELNRFVDPTIPLSWAVRWGLIRPLWPLLLVSWVAVVEAVAIQLLLSEVSAESAISRMLIVTVALPVGLLCGLELSVRLGHWTARRLQIRDRGVRFSHAKHGNVPWKRVLLFRIQPISGQPGLAKLSIEYAIDKKAKRKRTWSIVLEHPDQTAALRAQLGQQRDRGVLQAPLVELPEPVESTKTPIRILGVGRGALGWYVLAHGLALLGAGLVLDRPDRQERSTLPEQRTKAFHTIAQHFSSAEQFRQFILLTGAGLTACGLGFYAWGMRAMLRKTCSPERDGDHDRRDR